MSDQGIFLDILARLNLASVERVLKDVNTAMREGGRSSSRSFSEGFNLNGARAQFGELARASETAYRDMERGLQNLQIQESRINEMRANSYRHTSQAMIAAQREFDAALANSLRLMEAADARKASIAASRAVVAPASRGREEEPRGRGSVIPIPRAANVAGAGAALGLAGLGYEASRVAVDVQGSLNRVQAQQRDTSDNIRLLTQSVWQIAQQSGIKPKQIAGAYGNVERATNYVTGQGYRGQEAVDVMQNAAMLTRTAPGTSLDEAIQAITTTSHDYRIKVQDAAALLSAGAANVKGGMDDFANSLHSIEPIAQMAGIQPGEIIAALEQASQTGQTSQQSTPNLANLIKNLAKPQGTTSKALGQLNLDPEDISTHLSERHLAGTLQVIQQAILKKLGPDGNVNLGFAYQNVLETQEQQEDYDHLSPQVQALLRTPKFQNSEVGGSSKQLAKAFSDAGIQVDETDVPVVSDWLRKQKELHGPNSKIRSSKPEIENILGAYSDVAGGQDAGRMMMMLAGSPALLQQFQGRESDLGKQGTPNAFTASFKQAMSSDEAKFQKLGASAEALAGKMGEHLLPILGKVADDLNGFIDFLDRNKIAMDALVVVIGGLTAAWAGAKAINMFSDLSKIGGPLRSAANKLNPVLSDRLPTRSIGEASGVVAGSKEGATELAAGVVAGAKEGGALLTSAETEGGRLAAGQLTAGMTAGAKEAATQIAAGVTEGGKGAGAQVAEAMVGAGKEAGVEMAGAITEAGAGISGGLGGALRGAINPLLIATLGAGAIDSTIGKIEGAHPGAKPWLDILRNTPTGVGAWHWGKKGYDWLTGGKAHGGIVGYKGGTGAVDPYSQPLMGQPDMKRDSILGMLPGGMPVGLRGGEGILTPEAVHAIGGKDAIDGLNNNPWSNPLKVATTFYGSFADGVAKYSPWGKYLKASSQTLDSLTQEFDQSTKAHEGTDPLQHLINMGFDPSQLSPQTLQAMLGGYHTGNKGAPFPGGGWPEGPSGAPKDKKGIEEAVRQAYLEAGFDPKQWHDLEHIITHESGWNPTAKNPSSGAFGLGQFLGHEGDKYGAMGAYSGDPYREATAMMSYIRDRYGDPGNAWKFWQGHNWYSSGGVVGFADGGVTPGGGTDSGTGAPGIPDWWRKKLSSSIGGEGPPIPIDNAWMPNAGGAPLPPWISPSHLQGKGGIGGFSTGGIVGFDPGGVVPPPGPIPGPVPFPGMPRTNDDIAPPDQGSVGTPSGAARLGTGASSKPTVPKDDRLAQTKPVETPPGNSPPGSLVPQGTQPGMAPTPSGDRNINQNPSHNVAEGNTGKGFGLGGGLVGSLEGAAQSAISAAGLAADASGADGGGSAGAAAANQALQIGFQLANRAIGYGGQLAGIGLEGLSETFLPHDSEKSVPTKNLFGKIALGIAGAHPSGSNVAGDSAQQLKPKDDLDAGSQQSQGVTPMVHMENTTINHNGPGDVHNEMQRGINAALFGAGQLGG